MTCFLCGHHELPDRPAMTADIALMDEHFRVMHPDLWEQTERWPDGAPVVVDTTLEPSDFGGTP